ncbi:response regulator [uncultured Brevundimonas sp.]|mgnify:CR=1 FL=1|uniref:response regulator n=1 Tax=uncultured Brevundimonas sp. TaxID=213418 RepID=UPI0030ECB9BF|tara:strand:- start:24508 stop:26133 length:1626 start_codon:yes stop_codon:yes gene_type:complete
MPTIEDLTKRADPIGPTTLGSEVFARFAREPDTLGIAVVEDDRPIGLVERDAFLLKFASLHGHARYAERPITYAMDVEPAIVEAGVSIDTFSQALLNSGPGALLRSFIVTRDGIYHGIGSAVTLTQGLTRLQQEQNATLLEQAREFNDSQTQALTAARSRNQFLTVMSHELRTPMNGVLAVAELLRRQPLPTTALSHISTIVESSENLLQILNDALDLSRAEAGELELHPEPTPLRTLMDQVQAEWSRRAAEDRVTLMISYEGDTELGALIDGPRLKQVFNNLIGNALKFTRNGVIEASLKAWGEGDEVRMEARVRDDGPGLEAALLEHMFKPFIDGTDSSSAGLGSAICGRIIQNMGGRIWAENNTGRGTTFAFDLTVQRTAIEAPTVSNISEFSDEAFARTPHILIVDDNATNRVVAQALCEMFGITSETAEDGVEALEAIQARDFDLILMDIKMPRMDGIQATRAIRALTGPAAGIPIVALTANADPDDAKMYLSIGMCSVVEKPIKPERLRKAIHVALAQQASDAAVPPVTLNQSIA